MATHTVAAALVAALVTASCASGQSSDPEALATSTTAVTTTASPTTIPDDTTTTPPTTQGTTIDDQIAWVLDLLNGESTSEEEIADRFSAEFLVQASPEAVLTTISQLQGVSASWTVAGREGDAVGAEVDLVTDAGQWIMTIAVGTDGSIEFLSLQPDTLGDVERPTTFDEVVETLGAAGDVALLVADVSGGTCRPVHAVDASSPRPIGSDFKLYVLGALIEAIAAGDVRWADALEIRDDLKSLPSGSFRDLADGTELTVREFANAMIATSDNTATDHLMDLVGRERVEAAQATYGHTDPTLNEPMTTTREFFVLKLALSEDDRNAYIAARPDERRTILETVVAATDVSLDDAQTWVSPRVINEIEYFASPTDLCRAMVELHTESSEPSREPVRAILGANPGVFVDDSEWSYVGFKGGSEPGVLSLAWYLEGNSGAFVYVVNVTNDEKRLSETQLVGVAAAGFDLLAGS